MKVLLLTLFCCYTSSSPTGLEAEEEDDREAVGPGYLDYLLREKKYEEFNRLMAIDIPHLSTPRSENDKFDPRYSPYLEHGDILLTPRQKEYARSSINFTRWPGSKWPNGIVPVYITSQDYTQEEREYLWRCFLKCNMDLAPYCAGVKWYDSNTDGDCFVYVWNGRGCYSNIGRTGKQQQISLAKNGCLNLGTVRHELMHTLGFMHEQCREDRDDHIHMNWDNINDDWKSQFDKAFAPDFVVKNEEYNYYSIMHYPASHPDLCKNQSLRAFDVLDPNCDVDLIGKAEALNDLDKQNVKMMYCQP